MKQSFFKNIPLMLSLLTTLAIAATEIPLWAASFCLVMVAWRFLHERYAMYKISPSLTPLFGLIFFAIVYIEHRTFFGQEESLTILSGLAAILILNFAVERDKLFLVLLGFLMLVLKSVFSLDFIWILPALLSFFGLWVVLLGNTKVGAISYVLKTALRSVPVLLILFIGFPRFVLFQINKTRDNMATSGFREELSPGRFSSVSLSDELVFRAQFPSVERFDSERLYWRGSVLNVSNNFIWQKGLSERKVQNIYDAKRDSIIKYEVILEPTDVRNIFALDSPVRIKMATQPYLEWDQSIFLMINSPRQRVQFVGEASFSSEFTRADDPVDLPKYLKIAELPPRSKEWVINVKNKYKTTGERLKELINFFESPGFIYTLKADEYGNDMDQFLFVKKKGYCEHYAAAFGTLARALEIPARVIVGYQGGMYNELSDFWKISQRDAHAWVEVGVGKAWRRIDPTALAAPLRLTLGSTEYFSLSEDDQMLFSKERTWNKGSQLNKYYRNFLSVVDSLNYSWTIFLLNYDLQTQLEILKSFRINWIYIFIISVFALGLVFLFTRRKDNQRVRHKLHPLYTKIENWGLKNQLVFASDATPFQVLDQISTKFPEMRSFIDKFKNQYQLLVYKETSDIIKTEELRKEWNFLLKNIKK